MSILPCERVVKELLPAIRVSTAIQLHQTYNLNQSEIAKRLGITQASVSKYLSGNIHLNLKKLSNDSKVKLLASNLAFKLSKNELNDNQLANLICTACISYRQQDCPLKEELIVS